MARGSLSRYAEERSMVEEYERWENHHCPTCGCVNGDSNPLKTKTRIDAITRRYKTNIIDFINKRTVNKGSISSRDLYKEYQSFRDANNISDKIAPTTFGMVVAIITGKQTRQIQVDGKPKRCFVGLSVAT